ncbi:MAG TPA: hypothetical protein VF145_06300 [Chitinophagaceae bacterium]
MKPLITLTLMLASLALQAQSILNVLRLNEEMDYQTRRPRSIRLTEITYNSSGKTTRTAVKLFDEAGMVIMEDRYDNEGNVAAKLSYRNDTLRRLILSSSFERLYSWGATLEESTYSYDQNNCLVSMVTRDINGSVLLHLTFTCNEKGYPAEMTPVNVQGMSYGKETATYDYENNRVYTSFISTKGKVLSSDTGFISLTKRTDSLNLDKHGKVIKSFRRLQDGTTVEYEYEYSYDKYGNCLEERAYVISSTANGKPKRKLSRVLRREYSY